MLPRKRQRIAEIGRVRVSAAIAAAVPAATTAPAAAGVETEPVSDADVREAQTVKRIEEHLTQVGQWLIYYRKLTLTLTLTPTLTLTLALAPDADLQAGPRAERALDRGGPRRAAAPVAPDQAAADAHDHRGAQPRAAVLTGEPAVAAHAGAGAAARRTNPNTLRP